MKGEVWKVAVRNFAAEEEKAVGVSAKRAVEKARYEFGGSWPEVQAVVWVWVWHNRKMVIISFAFWKWRLSQIRGKVFEKAFGQCPFDWKTGPPL